MSLSTGKHLHVYIWIELPINKQIIQKVYELATKVKNPVMTKGYLIFEWIPGIPIMGQFDSKHTPDCENTPGSKLED